MFRVRNLVNTTTTTYYLLGALAALRLADMLRPALLECWEAGAPYKWAPSA